MFKVVEIMTYLLMAGICLLGYAAVALGFAFVLDVAAKELLGIDLLGRVRKWSSKSKR